MVRVLVAASGLLLLAGINAEARQITMERPRAEFGGRLSVVPMSGGTAVGGTPVVGWNIDPRTAIEASADFQKTASGFGTQQRRLVNVQLKRSLISEGNGRLFATIGGAGGWERTQPAYHGDFPNGQKVILGIARRRDVGGLTVGAGYDHVLNTHLALSAEAQILIGRYGPAIRTLVGVSTPLGHFRPSAALPGGRPGQTVWITTRDGRSWKGLLTDMSSTSVSVTREGALTTLSLADIRRIEAPDKVFDGIGKGALIGASAGLPLFIYGMTACGNDSECAGYAALYGFAWSGIGAGVGALIGGIADSLHEGRRTIFEGPSPLTVAPMITRHGAGIGAVIRW